MSSVIIPIAWLQDLPLLFCSLLSGSVLLQVFSCPVLQPATLHAVTREDKAMHQKVNYWLSKQRSLHFCLNVELRGTLQSYSQSCHPKAGSAVSMYFIIVVYLTLFVKDISQNIIIKYHLIHVSRCILEASRISNKYPSTLTP